jgi:uncharacterized protein
MTRLVPALLLLSVAMAACGNDAPAPAGDDAEDEVLFRHDGNLTFYRVIDGFEQELVSIAIEVAETEEAITRGLMGRQRLPERSGMLFKMPQTRIQSFWMANTPLALDITFVSADSTVINTAKYTRPFSSESHTSEAPARFVVETPAGFTDTHDIAPGDRVRWTRGQTL